MKQSLQNAMPKIVARYPSMNIRLINGAMWNAVILLETIDRPSPADWVGLVENTSAMLAAASSTYSRLEIEVFDLIVWTEILKDRFNKSKWVGYFDEFMEDLGVSQPTLDAMIASTDRIDHVVYSAYDPQTRDAWSAILNAWARADKLLAK